MDGVPLRADNTSTASAKGAALSIEFDIAEHDVPQDGCFQVAADDREIDFRVSIMPNLFEHLAVEPEEIVHSRDPNHWRLVSKSRVWPMPVVAVDEGLQRSLA